MSDNLKRYFGSTIVNSEINGLHVLRHAGFPADQSGEIQDNSKHEITESWFASDEDLERLYDLLCQVLNKPRSIS